MKLSDAIRKGCKEHPQALGVSAEYTWGTEELKSTCAIAAGVVGLTDLKVYHSGLMDQAEALFPILLKQVPEGFGRYGGCNVPIRTAIVSLNDTHRWSREAIAEWVATIEEFYEQTQSLNIELVCEESVKEVVCSS